MHQRHKIILSPDITVSQPLIKRETTKRNALTNRYRDKTTAELISKAFSIGMTQDRLEITNFWKYLKDKNIQNVLEIGSDKGGAFYLWCCLNKKKGKKISLDLPHSRFGSKDYNVEARNKSMRTWANNVFIVEGDSHKEDTLLKIKEILGEDKLDLLFIDADHTYEGINKDYEMYRGLVKEEGYIALHDIADSDSNKKLKCHVFDKWAEIEQDSVKTLEFINSSCELGIGVVVKHDILPHSDIVLKDNYQHFFISRFNVYLKEFIASGRIDQSEKEWMDYRMNIFRYTCLPSIQNQTDQDFKWLCFFDDRTDDIYKKIIMRYHEEYNNFIPCFISPKGTAKRLDICWPDSIKRGIFDLSPSNIRYVSQARIDIDDCIHKDYVKHVKEWIIGKKFERQVIYFKNGYILDTDKMRLYKKMMAYNQFSVIVETKRSITPIFTYPHSDLLNHYSPHWINSGDRAWVWVYHNNNLSTVTAVILSPFRGHIFPCDYNKVLLKKDFGFDDRVFMGIWKACKNSADKG